MYVCAFVSVYVRMRACLSVGARVRIRCGMRARARVCGVCVRVLVSVLAAGFRASKPAEL